MKKKTPKPSEDIKTISVRKTMKPRKKQPKQRKQTKDISEPQKGDIKDPDLPKVTSGSVIEKKKWNRLTFWDKRKLKKNPEHSWLIRMKYSNGTSREFVMMTKEEVFTYKGRTFYLRHEDSWFNLTQNQFELDMHEDFTCPLDREIQKKGEKAYWSVTPENIKPIIEMNYVRVLAQGDGDKYAKMAATLAAIIFLAMIFVIYRLMQLAPAA